MAFLFEVYKGKKCYMSTTYKECAYKRDIRASLRKAGYTIKVNGKVFTERKKHENKKMSGPVMVYWLIATAIYLAWSFTTNDWDRTWIIWPVVGVLFPAFYAIVNGIRKKS